MKRWAVLFALLLALLPFSLRAHGGGVPQITAEPVGGYLLYLWTDPAAPRAGDTLHVTVGLTLPAQDGTETPVTDASVTVTLAPQEGGAPITLPAEPGAAAGGVFYEADAVLPVGGDWRIAVAVDGVQGAGNVEFTLPVAASGLPWGRLLGGASAVLLIVLALPVFRRRIIRRSRLEAAQP